MSSTHQVAVQTLIALVWLAGPAIMLTFAVGLLISVIQAVTQIQDSSLSFAPKIVALVALFGLGGASMFHGVTDYATVLFQSIPALVAHG